jgi:hypothetical protein
LELGFHEHGAVRLHGAAAPFLSSLERMVAALPVGRAGVRLHDVQSLAPLLASSAIGAFPAGLVGARLQPVRAILFDKHGTNNWALGWHQDRTIAVKARAEVPGFGPWTMKAGMQHVEPPFAFIERMVTVRVHLDDVPPENAPLLIAPGSHRLGRIAEAELSRVIDRCGAVANLAIAGDLWIYATPIVHASAAARGAKHRRVLQVDYSADALPAGLEWLGV